MIREMPTAFFFLWEISKRALAEVAKQVIKAAPKLIDFRGVYELPEDRPGMSSKELLK